MLRVLSHKEALLVNKQLASMSLDASSHELIEMHERNVRKAHKREPTKTTNKKQPHQAAKPLHVVVRIFLKDSDQQLDQVDNEAGEPAQEV